MCVYQRGDESLSFTDIRTEKDALLKIYEEEPHEGKRTEKPDLCRTTITASPTVNSLISKCFKAVDWIFKEIVHLQNDFFTQHVVISFFCKTEKKIF